MKTMEAKNEETLAKNESAIDRFRLSSVEAIEGLRTDSVKAIEGLRTDNVKTIGELRTDNVEAIGGLRTDMERLRTTIFVQIISVAALVVAVSVVIGYLQFFS